MNRRRYEDKNYTQQYGDEIHQDGEGESDEYQGFRNEYDGEQGGENYQHDDEREHHQSEERDPSEERPVDKTRDQGQSQSQSQSRNESQNESQESKIKLEKIEEETKNVKNLGGVIQLETEWVEANLKRHIIEIQGSEEELNQAISNKIGDFHIDSLEILTDGLKQAYKAQQLSATKDRTTKMSLELIYEGLLRQIAKLSNQTTIEDTDVNRIYLVKNIKRWQYLCTKKLIPESTFSEILQKLKETFGLEGDTTDPSRLLGEFIRQSKDNYKKEMEAITKKLRVVPIVNDYLTFNHDEADSKIIIAKQLFHSNVNFCKIWPQVVQRKLDYLESFCVRNGSTWKDKSREIETYNYLNEQIMGPLITLLKESLGPMNEPIRNAMGDSENIFLKESFLMDLHFDEINNTLFIYDHVLQPDNREAMRELYLHLRDAGRGIKVRFMFRDNRCPVEDLVHLINGLKVQELMLYAHKSMREECISYFTDVISLLEKPINLKFRIRDLFENRGRETKPERRLDTNRVPTLLTIATRRCPNGLTIDMLYTRPPVLLLEILNYLLPKFVGQTLKLEFPEKNDYAWDNILDTNIYFLKALYVEGQKAAENLSGVLAQFASYTVDITPPLSDYKIPLSKREGRPYSIPKATDFGKVEKELSERNIEKKKQLVYQYEAGHDDLEFGLLPAKPKETSLREAVPKLQKQTYSQEDNYKQARLAYNKKNQWENQYLNSNPSQNQASRGDETGTNSNRSNNSALQTSQGLQKGLDSNTDTGSLKQNLNTQNGSNNNGLPQTPGYALGARNETGPGNSSLRKGNKNSEWGL